MTRSWISAWERVAELLVLLGRCFNQLDPALKETM